MEGDLLELLSEEEREWWESLNGNATHLGYIAAKRLLTRLAESRKREQGLQKKLDDLERPYTEPWGACLSD